MLCLLPNPRGSTGYGQQFVNEISGDWGGKVYIDLMNGVADVLRRNSFIDRNRIGAAGASYGGYMVNWILGHNNDPRFRFKVLVSHDGVYNLESMYGDDGRTLVPGVGVQRNAWTNPAHVQSLVTAQVRAEFQHADPDHSRRARLPRADRRRDAIVHGGTAQRHRLQDA